MPKLPTLPSSPARAVLFGLAAGAIALLALVLALVFWDDVVPREEAQAKHDAGEEAADITEAKLAIQIRAPHADTLTYGKVRVAWMGDTSAVCGRVDIEQPDDSLEGPERFIFVEDQLLLESFDGTDALDQKWRDVCDGA